MDHWHTQKNVNLHVPKEQGLQAHTNECQPMYIPTECGLLTHNDRLIPPKYRSLKERPPFKVSPEGLDTLKWLSTWLYQRNRNYWYRDESQPACMKTIWTTDKEINVNLHVTREHEYWHTEMNVSLYVPSINMDLHVPSMKKGKWTLDTEMNANLYVTTEHGLLTHRILNLQLKREHGVYWSGNICEPALIWMEH